MTVTLFIFFFFKQKTAYEMRISDWSSDVCSSDLPDTLQGLDDLLARRPGQVATWLSWMRNAPQSPAARNILRLIERLAYIPALGLDRARADMLPSFTFARLAVECSRTTAPPLGQLTPLRRHATPPRSEERRVGTEGRSAV